MDSNEDMMDSSEDMRDMCEHLQVQDSNRQIRQFSGLLWFRWFQRFQWRKQRPRKQMQGRQITRRNETFLVGDAA